MKKNAYFISVWDGGVTLTTACNYNPETKVVSDIDSVDVDVEILEEEYVVFNDIEIRDFINADDFSITIQEVREFLKEFCTEVQENEAPDYVELKMDDHRCLNFEGKQYYVPENSVLFTTEDYEVIEYLQMIQ